MFCRMVSASSHPHVSRTAPPDFQPTRPPPAHSATSSLHRQLTSRPPTIANRAPFARLTKIVQPAPLGTVDRRPRPPSTAEQPSGATILDVPTSPGEFGTVYSQHRPPSTTAITSPLRRLGACEPIGQPLLRPREVEKPRENLDHSPTVCRSLIRDPIPPQPCTVPCLTFVLSLPGGCLLGCSA